MPNATEPPADGARVALATKRVRELLDTTGPASDELRARVREILAPVLPTDPPAVDSLADPRGESRQ